MIVEEQAEKGDSLLSEILHGDTYFQECAVANVYKLMWEWIPKPGNGYVHFLKISKIVKCELNVRKLIYERLESVIRITSIVYNYRAVRNLHINRVRGLWFLCPHTSIIIITWLYTTLLSACFLCWVYIFIHKLEKTPKNPHQLRTDQGLKHL